MFPEYERYQFSPEVVEDLREQLSGKSSTPIYSQMKKKEVNRDKVESAQEKFLRAAESFPTRSFDIDADQIPLLLSALSGTLLESLAGSQEGIVDKYASNHETFNAGYVAAIVTMQNLLRTAVQ